MSFPWGVKMPSHLLYADDVLLFCKGTIKTLRRLKEALSLYESLSGQHVNWDKSYMFFGAGIQTRRVTNILQMMGIKRGTLPFTYLGIPLFKGAPKKIHLRPIAHKIQSQLSSWKGNTLSMAGRGCLINSVITSMFIHSFMIYKWPKNLLADLNSKIRNFLWTGSIDKRKLITASWNDCCVPIKEGGLGIKNLSSLNKALLRKLTWKIMTSDSFVFTFFRDRFSRHTNRGFYT